MVLRALPRETWLRVDRSGAEGGQLAHRGRAALTRGQLAWRIPSSLQLQGLSSELEELLVQLVHTVFHLLDLPLETRGTRPALRPLVF